MVQLLNHKEVRHLLPPRPPDGHKGSFGHLAVAAGSTGFAGAVKLACLGAYRSGAGLVTACVPAAIFDSLASSLTEVMLKKCSSTAEGSLSEAAFSELMSFCGDKSTLLLGPGLSRHEETVRCVRRLCREITLPLVIDADALNALAEHKDDMKDAFHLREEPVIVTPHPGEMSRLAGLPTAYIQKNRIPVALEFAQRWQVITALKGKDTIIAAPDGRVALCPLGNNGMATGGSGDVLAGIAGALLAQKIPAFDAACAAVYVHALAGDFAARRLGTRALIAGDIIDALPPAWQALEGYGL
ncbi:MAG TPA: NAD(P)H-hydrate dehydratase [Candidatus Hydrogenedentes bacterium]|nr:NAD(P)H-hydrate dehydratase [Candidatus Hydrogenedentota bacterium]